MKNCESCKWFNKDECAMGLESSTCASYAKPVEESCRQCEWHLGMGQCRLNLEHECAEDHYAMYTLARGVKRDCGTCDSFRGGECAQGRTFSGYCMGYTWWPVVPNWGTKA